MNVSAIIVTRGDVGLGPIFDSLPKDWEILIWDNGREELRVSRREGYDWVATGQDLSVYGRYAAIEYASHDLIYVQDDDVIVSDPAKIVRAWNLAHDSCQGEFDPRLLWQASPEEIRGAAAGEHVVCNMPQEFRHEFYENHALVGFGACFHRDAPARAFGRFWIQEQADVVVAGKGTRARVPQPATQRFPQEMDDLFRRTCDIVFTALTSRVLVDVPRENLPWAFGPNRMWTTPGHLTEREAMLKLALSVRG